MRLAIRTRLTAFYALFAAITLLTVGTFLVVVLRRDLRAAIDTELRGSSGAISQSYAREGLAGFRETAAASLRRSGSEAQILDPSGRVLAAHGGDLAQDPMISRAQLAAAQAAGTRLQAVNLGDAKVPFHVLSVATHRRGHPAVVVVGESLQGVEDASHKILVLLLIAGPIVLTATALGAWLLVGGALRPVTRMRRKAQMIGIDRLDERLVAPNTGDEIGRLAATLNAMLDRLQAGVLARRQLVADASHDLRTPLAAMRAELDVALRERGRSDRERAVMESLRDEVDRMSRTVDNLLTLARADEGRLDLHLQEIDLTELAEGAAGPLRALAVAGEISLRLDGEPARAYGDPDRLHQAVRNLVENAIKYTPPGGSVEVRTWHGESEVGITVSDDGIGIPADMRDHVFGRFFRVDRSRSRASGGSGLGLAICYEIAAAHGGRVSVRSEAGRGSSFTLALPGVSRLPHAPAAAAAAPQRPGR